MLFTLPKKQEQIFWTKHSREKMQQYNLSEKRVLKVIKNPERKEEGIVPETIAVMQTTGTKKNPKEIWVMYQVERKKNFSKIKIISAWRYLGKTKIGKSPVIPEDTLQEISKITF